MNTKPKLFPALRSLVVELAAMPASDRHDVAALEERIYEAYGEAIMGNPDIKPRALSLAAASIIWAGLTGDERGAFVLVPSDPPDQPQGWGVFSPDSGKWREYSR